MIHEDDPRSIIVALVEEIRLSRERWVTEESNRSLSRAYVDSIEESFTIIESPLLSLQDKKMLSECLIDYAKLQVSRGMTITHANATKLLKMLEHDLLIDNITKQPDGNRTLAWLCLRSAWGIQHVKLNDKGQHLNAFIKMWTGSKLPNPRYPKLLQTAAIIFGGHPEANMLLGFDEHKALPDELWIKNLPVVIKRKVDDCALVLPMDM